MSEEQEIAMVEALELEMAEMVAKAEDAGSSTSCLCSDYRSGD